MGVPGSTVEETCEETGVTCEAFHPFVIPKDELCTAVLSRTDKSLAALGHGSGKHHWPRTSARPVTGRGFGGSVTQDLLATGQPGDGIPNAIGGRELCGPSQQVLGTV